MSSARATSWWRRARSEFEARLPMAITHVVPIDHPESEAVVARRRRVVAGVSVLGTSLLGLSLSTKPNSKEFYGLTAAVAATWTAGGLFSGPLHLGWIQSRDQRLRRPIITPIATGVGAFGFFYGCALVARGIPVLDRAIGRVLAFAEEGSGPMVVATTLANGLGEEIFFRGAVYAALEEDRAVVVSTAVYTLATVSTRNPSLVRSSWGDGDALQHAAACLRWAAGSGADAPHVVDADGALPAAPVQTRPPLLTDLSGVGAAVAPCSSDNSVMERVTRIELALSAWEADVLPLNYTRTTSPAAPQGRPEDERGRYYRAAGPPRRHPE